MDIRPLTETYAVSPQIAPEHCAELSAQGFTTVICNRPDGENPPEWQAAAIRTAAEMAGLDFVYNPVVGGALSMDNVTAQADAIAKGGKIFAYCASGNRSSIVWALSQAGTRPTDELIAAGAQYGYMTGQFRDLIDKLAAGK
jgi:uncharacterized protein (TIGR01244 family)